MKEFYVYRFLDKNGKPIYVGRTKNLKDRMAKHFLSRKKDIVKRNKITEKIEYLTFDKNTYSAIYEIFFINLWKPEFNIDSKYNEEITTGFLNTENLQWVELDVEHLKELKSKIHVSKKGSAFRDFRKNEVKSFEVLENRLNIVLKHSEKVVLALMWRAEKNDELCDTSFLINKGNLSVSTLKRVAISLQEANLITVENTRSQNGRRQGTNKYRLTEGGAF